MLTLDALQGAQGSWHLTEIQLPANNTALAVHSNVWNLLTKQRSGNRSGPLGNGDEDNAESNNSISTHVPGECSDKRSSHECDRRMCQIPAANSISEDGECKYESSPWCMRCAPKDTAGLQRVTNKLLRDAPSKRVTRVLCWSYIPPRKTTFWGSTEQLYSVICACDATNTFPFRRNCTHCQAGRLGTVAVLSGVI